MAGGNNVKALLKSIAKDAGKEVGVYGMRDDDPTRLLTGMFTLDLITGGGIPEGRVTLIYGPEAGMKTTLALKCIRAAQRKYPDRTAVFIDVEGHLDKTWTKKMGVDVEKLVHIIPENAEQAVDIAEAMLHAEDVSLVAFDSLAALQVQQELDKDADQASPGKQALVINRFYRKSTHALNDARTAGGFAPTLIVINQIRYKIGAAPGHDPEAMPGGPAFKFAAALSLRVSGSDVMQASVHKTLPAFRRVAVTIKKHKVPVIAKKGELLVALQPIPDQNLKPGELYAWNTVLQYLKMLNLFSKPEKTWDLINPGTGEVEHFKTQDELKDKLRENPDYADVLYAGLIQAVMVSGEAIEAE